MDYSREKALDGHRILYRDRDRSGLGPVRVGSLQRHSANPRYLIVTFEDGDLVSAPANVIESRIEGMYKERNVTQDLLESRLWEVLEDTSVFQVSFDEFRNCTAKCYSPRGEIEWTTSSPPSKIKGEEWSQLLKALGVFGKVSYTKKPNQ